MTSAKDPNVRIFRESQERAREIRPHGDMIKAARFFLANTRSKETRDLDRRHYEYATLVFAIFALEGFLNFIAKRLKKPAAFTGRRGPGPATKLDKLLAETRLTSALKAERNLICTAILYRNDLAHPKHIPLRRWVGRKMIRIINDAEGINILTPMESLLTRVERFCDSPKLKKLVAAVEKTCATMYKKTGGDLGPLNQPWDWSGWSSSGMSPGSWEEVPRLPAGTSASRRLGFHVE